MTLQENYSLDGLNTLGLKSTARYFTVIKNETDLVEVAFFLKNKKLPFFILGGGSNLVLPEIVDGLVIKSEILGKDLKLIGNGVFHLGLGSGERWDDGVSYAVKNNLVGLENLSAIPGTVGAAPVQNIGAYGVEASQCIVTVETFDLEKMTKKVWTNKDCAFGYRDSIFKKAENKKYFITKVVFQVKQNAWPTLEYKDLKNYFAERNNLKPTLTEVRNAILEIRQSKLPDWRVLGSVGSFFKNPIVSIEHYDEIKKIYPELIGYPVDGKKMKIPLGFVFDKICNLKGLKFGHVGLYEKQALVLVNYGGATISDIELFTDNLFATVKEKIGVGIEWEAEKVLPKKFQ
ncbi:MAG: UDP-N-acetylmuramate dehydrogenase [bacterium]